MFKMIEENKQSKSVKPSYLSTARMSVYDFRFLQLSVNAVFVCKATLTLAHVFYKSKTN